MKRLANKYIVFLLLLGPAARRGPSLKFAFFFLSLFWRCRKSALLRTLIGPRAVCRSRAFDVVRTVLFECEWRNMNDAFGPFNLKLTQINSEMYWDRSLTIRKKLETRGENLNATSPRVCSKSNLHSLSLNYFKIVHWRRKCKLFLNDDSTSRC